ncbi:claudin-23 [Amia ocellicauda]|uniref:claudin-23 n=1 Tax=Amia ocellicauda TaxID=2972642 RepID=UPI00346400C1|nr:CLD23 protein [Amia calva]
MQTPAAMVAGIVCAPLGLILVFTAVITPHWRECQVRAGRAWALRTDGLWESCLQVAESDFKVCWPVSGAYYRDAHVRWARGLLLSSLFLCGTGIVLASVGVRCWMDFPQRNVAGTSGLVVLVSGLLCLATLGLYVSNIQALGSNPKLVWHRGGSSLYFGWVGGGIQILGGAVLSLSFKRPKCPMCPTKAPSGDKDSYDISC